MSEDELIHTISKASDRYGNKLIQFLDRYGLTGLREAKLKQLEEFNRKEHLQ